MNNKFFLFKPSNNHIILNQITPRKSVKHKDAYIQKFGILLGPATRMALKVIEACCNLQFRIYIAVSTIFLEVLEGFINALHIKNVC